MADTNNQRTRAVDNAQQYVYARDAGHLSYVRKARRCLDFVDSYGDKQWEETVAKQLRAEGKPVLTIGRIFPTMAVLMGEQLQSETDVAFRATSSGDPDVATALDKFWLHTSHVNDYNFLKGEVFDQGTITSRGFLDVRMSFEDNIKGDIKITRKDGRNVVIDADASSYDPKDWNQVFLTTWHTPQGISELYGKGAGERLKARPYSAFGYGGTDFLDFPVGTFGQQMGFQNLLTGPDGAKLRRYVRVIERQYVERRRMPHFVDPASGETRPVPNNWDDERIRRVVEQAGVLVAPLMGRSLRWTVSADDELLHDEVMPYEYFTVVPFFPHLIAGRTIGMVENLIGSQEGLNKTRSQELHIVNSIANSGWITRRGNIQNMEPEELEQRGAETGLVLEVDDVAQTVKISPNQVPTGLERIGFKFGEDFETTTNVGGALTGTAREDVSGKALRQQEARGSIGQARPMQNLARTDAMVATRVLSLAQRYYTDERVLNVVNRDPRRTAETLVINQVQPDGTITNDLTTGEYDVITSPVQQREQHEDTVFDQAVAMRELGIKIDDAVIVENSRLPNKQQILEGLEPSDNEQRMAELEMEKAEAEVDAIKAKNMDTRAAAVDKVARARRAAQDADSSQDQGDDTANLAMEKYKIDRELELERYKADQEFAIEREKMRRETRLRERELRMKESQSDGDAEKSRAA